MVLCRAHQRSYCVWSPTGTAALWATLTALGLEKRSVAIPCGVCLNIPLAIKYTSAKPIYCDIDEKSLGLSADVLHATIEAPDAVLAVHAYGNVCDIQSIADFCQTKSIPLIEDVAVAQGALTRDNRPAGSFGTASIVSFGRGKIVDIGGGGAVMTNDPALAREIGARLQALPLRSSIDEQKIDQFSSLHTQLYNQHYGKDLRDHLRHFVARAAELRGPTLTNFSWSRDAAARGVEELPRNLNRRRELARYLFNRLPRFGDIRFDPRQLEEAAIWRANLFSSSHRNKLLRSMLAEGLKISSWYPPAQDFLEDGDMGQTPFARKVGAEILNVWINEEVDAAYLDAVISKIATVQC